MDKIRISHSKRNREVRILSDDSSKSVSLKGKKRFNVQNIPDKINNHVVLNRKKYLIGILLTGCCLALIIMLVSFIASTYVYAIKIDNDVVCYVNTKRQAEKAINMVIEEYTPDNTIVKAVDTDKDVEIVHFRKSSLNDPKLLSTEAAYDCLSDMVKKEKAIDITIASAKTEIKKYIPTPKYVLDKEMVAGDSKVIKQGKDGRQKISTTYISVNGKIKSKKVTARKVIDNGEKSTVKKGCIGLPEGEDWKTFEGAPVFKDGEELSEAGLAHLGAPYKYGGYSFVTGIDCVQLVRALYKQYGITLPNNHSGIQHSGKGVSLSNAKKGDIVCYRHHMGIYIGDGKMVNALHGGVSISRVKKGKLVTIRRVVK